MKPSVRPLEKLDGSWTFKSRRVADLAAVVKAGDLLYTEPAPFGERWDARKGEAPRFAELQAALATRGLRAVYAQSFYWRIERHVVATSAVTQGVAL